MRTITRPLAALAIAAAALTLTQSLRDQGEREMRSLKFLRAWRVFLYAAILINLASLILDVLVGSVFAVMPVVMIAALAVVIRGQTRTIRRREELDRPRPDYSLIATMEREVYGETFEHEGAPEIARPVHMVAGQTGMCKRCMTPYPRIDGRCAACYKARRVEGPS